PFAQVRQDPDEVARLLQDGAGRGLDVHAQLARHEHGERSLAEPWRAVEQRVVERFTPRERGIDGDAEALLDLRLADELLQPLRPQRQLDRALLAQDFRRGDLRTHALPCECFRAALGVGAWYPGEPWGLRAPRPLRGRWAPLRWAPALRAWAPRRLRRRWAPALRAWNRTGTVHRPLPAPAPPARSLAKRSPARRSPAPAKRERSPARPKGGGAAPRPAGGAGGGRRRGGAPAAPGPRPAANSAHPACVEQPTMTEEGTWTTAASVARRGARSPAWWCWASRQSPWPPAAA